MIQLLLISIIFILPIQASSSFLLPHRPGVPPGSQGVSMPFHNDIFNVARQNSNFRKVVETGNYSQVVVMSIPVGGEIGQETHKSTDQILVCVEGEGKAILNGQTILFKPHDLVMVKAGTQHNFINTSSTKDLKLFTVYAPPAHRPTTVHKTKADADKDKTDIYKSEQKKY